MMAKKAAKIVTVFNQKGGAGKTTSTCQIAGTFGHRGYDVLVADLDKQSSASKWLSAADESAPFPASLWAGHMYKGNIATELGKLSEKYDLIFLDCAPAVDQPGTWASLLVNDLAIIPTKLGPADTDALHDAFELAKRARIESGLNFPVRVLATAYRKARSDERIALAKLAENERYPDFPAFKTSLADRIAYPRAMLYGATAHSMPKAGDAIEELESLADEIAALLAMPKRKKSK